MLPVCVVFDLDDTLLLERDYVISGFAAVGSWARRRFAIDDFAGRACRQFEAGVRGRIFDSVLRDCGYEASAEDIQEMVTIYRRHRPEVALLPDAAEFINAHYGLVKLALITDGPADAQRRKVMATGLNKVMDCLILTDLWGRAFWKPHRRAFQLIEKLIGGGGMRYVYVADNPSKDFAAPAALSWRTVRIRRKRGLHVSAESPAGLTPEFQLPDLTSLPSLVRAIGRQRPQRIPLYA